MRSPTKYSFTNPYIIDRLSCLNHGTLRCQWRANDFPLSLAVQFSINLWKTEYNHLCQQRNSRADVKTNNSSCSYPRSLWAMACVWYVKCKWLAINWWPGCACLLARPYDLITCDRSTGGWQFSRQLVRNYYNWQKVASPSTKSSSAASCPWTAGTSTE